jgi:lipid II:glycine glycyltransferase (peptidoglycan interpeptide bridge formation enzyme)
MIYNLIQELKCLSIDELDFGGISSDGSSAGVDFFKLGFNGDELSKLGEFDISKSKVYSYFFNKLLQFKKNT